MLKKILKAIKGFSVLQESLFSPPPNTINPHLVIAPWAYLLGIPSPSAPPLVGWVFVVHNRYHFGEKALRVAHGDVQLGAGFDESSSEIKPDGGGGGKKGKLWLLTLILRRCNGATNNKVR
mgnify:CR=1 FL=1